MIEVLNSYLCHDCGSDHAISEVVYGKIKINLCGECIDKKEEQKEFKFPELSDKAKALSKGIKEPSSPSSTMRAMSPPIAAS